ncbi:MAG: hypothetical protein RL227_2587 [Pseudomonadota bacterium]|jgi:hypothetical protein
MPLSYPQRRASLRVGAASVLALLTACGGGGDGTPARAPALDIRSDVNGEARAPFTVTFFFSDDVELPGGTLAFSLSGGSIVAGSFRRIDERTASVRIRPNASARGLVEMRVPAGAFRDATGSASNTVAYAFVQAYDTLPPFASLSFGGPVDALGFITGMGTFTLSFSVPLDAPLAVAGLEAAPGTISGLSKTSAAGAPDVYTFSYMPPAATFGGVTVELLQGAVSRGGIPNDRERWTFGLASR